MTGGDHAPKSAVPPGPSFAAIAEHFLSQCLGGPAEPYGDDLVGSDVELKAGAAFIPGLEQAFAASRKAASADK